MAFIINFIVSLICFFRNNSSLRIKHKDLQYMFAIAVGRWYNLEEVDTLMPVKRILKETI